MRRDVERGWWWIVVAALTVSAVAAATSVLRNDDLDDVHFRILATALVGLLCGAAALAGLMLLERRQALPLAGAAIAASLVQFVLAALAIWNDDLVDETYAKALMSAFAVLLATLVVSALRLVADVSLRPVWLLFCAVAALAAGGVALALVGIWRTGADEVGESDLVDDGGRALIGLFCLVVVGFLVAPALERALARRSEPEPPS